MRSASDYNHGWADAEIDADGGMLLTESELLQDGYHMTRGYDYVMGYIDCASAELARVEL